MKSIMFAVILTSLSATAGIFNKTPSKEFLSRKIGIWVPSLAEPEARNYTLEEFVDGAFRNVTSKDWEETDDSWILIVKIKDPMSKKKSTAKMMFLKSDSVAGPRRITMDGEDLPMRQASSVMHPLLSNVTEKFGTREVKKKENGSIEKFKGKYCGNNNLVIDQISENEITISADNNGACNFKNKSFKRVLSDDKMIYFEINSKCKIYIEERAVEKLNRHTILFNSVCSGNPIELNKCDLSNFGYMTPCN